MTSPRRVAVWLDHHEARIFHVDLDSFDERALAAPLHRIHSPKAAVEPKARKDEEHHFFADIAKALATADEVLVLGPSTAKMQFLHYLHEHARPLEGRVIGVETADHPTDAQIVAHVRAHFKIPLPRLH